MDQRRHNPTPREWTDPDRLGDLARDLAGLTDPRIEVPPAVDDTVLTIARSMLARQRRHHRPGLHVITRDEAVEVRPARHGRPGGVASIPRHRHGHFAEQDTETMAPQWQGTKSQDERERHHCKPP